MLRKYHIVNEIHNEIMGTLYMDKETEFVKIELLDDYTGLHPSIFFNIAGNEQGRKYIEGDLAMSYLTHRVLPPDRQALSMFLNDMGLTEYNIFDILDFTKGRCVMDHDYFVEIKD